ncbi:BnaA08g25570D [Brassica napus]|uniref:BnaA08g25570D protein n=1 Tax=Brassica napus TaxID=3708 RepID=A0A078G8H5_BRANA|nr:BnaA08g25570D [Brassica napus]
MAGRDTLQLHVVARSLRVMRRLVMQFIIWGMREKA